LDADSGAFAVQFGRSTGTPYASKVGADAWFDRYDADRFEVREQTVRYLADQTLTLVIIEDEEMLLD
jgi:hypothetical protein